MQEGQEPLEHAIAKLPGIEQPATGPNGGDCGAYHIAELCDRMGIDGITIKAVRQVYKFLIMDETDEDDDMAGFNHEIKSTIRGGMNHENQFRKDSMYAAYGSEIETSDQRSDLMGNITLTEEERYPSHALYLGGHTLIATFYYFAMDRLERSFESVQPLIELTEFGTFKANVERGSLNRDTHYLINRSAHFVLAWMEDRNGDGDSRCVHGIIGYILHISHTHNDYFN